MVNRLRLPAVLATVVLTGAATAAATSCGSGKPKPDARAADAREPDAFVDPCEDISFGIHCVDDGTGSGSGTCPECADSFGMCPPGCTPV
jgi:hypothetical protein